VDALVNRLDRAQEWSFFEDSRYREVLELLDPGVINPMQRGSGSMSERESDNQADGGNYRGNSRLRLRLDKTAKAGVPIGTKSCNLDCLMCHNDYFLYADGSIRAISNQAFADAVRKVIAASRVSQSVIYLAGSGEPTTVGIAELTNLIQLLKEIPEVTAVRMTTNGVLLKDMAQPLKKAGLDGVRVSINSLDKQVYFFITGAYGLEAAIEGIKASLATGLEVKVNVIYSKLNDREIDDFIRFSRSHEGVVVKFFDLLPNNRLSERLHLPINQLENKLARHACEVLTLDQVYPSRLYVFDPPGLVQVKGFSTNHCPNLTCIARDLCVEDCRDMVRIGLDGIMRPCGVREDNTINLIAPSVTEEHIREALHSGGKLETSDPIDTQVIKSKSPNIQTSGNDV